jgi:hypothetical protein
VNSHIPYLTIGQLLAIFGMLVLALLAPDIAARRWMCAGWLVAYIPMGIRAISQIVSYRCAETKTCPTEESLPK